MKMTRLVVAGAFAGLMLAAGGSSTTGLIASTQVAKAEPSVMADEKCSETAKRFGNNGYVYLYTYDYCKGDHDEKDNSNDADYGDGKYQIKDFDNRTNSLINKGYKNIEFYNYPDFNEGHPEGDAFCVQRGHWVNNLDLYGDNSNDWQNSISSHKWVSASSCDRWFG